jgi:hypothetical protein
LLGGALPTGWLYSWEEGIGLKSVIYLGNNEFLRQGHGSLVELGTTNDKGLLLVDTRC